MQIAVDHERLPLQTHLQVSLLDINSELLGRGAFGDGNVDCHFSQSLFPRVFVCRTAISCIRKLSLRLFFVLILFILVFLFCFSSSVSLSRIDMSCNTWISLASGFLGLDQGSLLFGHFTSLIIIGDNLACSFLSSAFGFCLFLSSLLLLLDGLLLGFFILKKFNVLSQVLVDSGQGALLLGIEVRLACKETKQAVKVVVDALGLLHTCHEQPVKFVSHPSILQNQINYRKF